MKKAAKRTGGAWLQHIMVRDVNVVQQCPLGWQPGGPALDGVSHQTTPSPGAELRWCTNADEANIVDGAEGCKDVRTWHECIVLIEELLPCRRGKELSQWPRACPTAADSLTSMSNAVDYLECPPIPKSVSTRSKAHWLHVHVDRGTAPGTLTMPEAVLQLVKAGYDLGQPAG
ncbi:hypothetical protein ACK3TF_004659 [Chlorella vulgaris]